MPVETQCLRLNDAKLNAQNHSLRSIIDFQSFNFDKVPSLCQSSR
jgi:hypothetical protein